LDLGLPPDPDGPTEGLRLLEEFLTHNPAMKVVVLTGNTDHENAVRSVQLGAYDYYLKPIVLADLRLILQRACQLSRLDRETFRLQAPRQATTPDMDIVGTSNAMARVFDIIRRVARTDVTVLISGESGTGKELVARAIHTKSPRRQRPFVAINCAAIPENLVESELFGHEKGAFTGAQSQRKGRLELAEGGTVFLDEIAELPPHIQVKILRVLQERQCERVGGRELIPLDNRILAATNRDITRTTQEGKFREDLYYRLAVVRIDLPPLRARPDDLNALAMHFLERFSTEYKVPTRPFSADALKAIHGHPWPGNVRELENRIKRALIMAEGRRITAADLELAPTMPAASLKGSIEEAERGAVVEALKRCQGNISQTARALRTSRPTLYFLLTKHSLRPRDFKTSTRSES
jgi:two-component system NtrC family response regulator